VLGQTVSGCWPRWSMERRPRSIPDRGPLDGAGGRARELGDEATYRGRWRRATALLWTAGVYNRACLASIARDVEQALSLLAEALAADPGQKAWARKDPDLRWLHGEERFWELVGGRGDAEDAGMKASGERRRGDGEIG